MAFFTLSMCEIFHSLNMRSRTKSIFRLPKHNNLIGRHVILVCPDHDRHLSAGPNKTIFKLTALVDQQRFNRHWAGLFDYPAGGVVKLVKGKRLSI